MNAADRQRVLVTGGAGFIGANVAIELATRHPEWEIIALDNLKRRGSELMEIGELDALVECSAEPSVMAGIDGSPDYLIQSNLIGAYHCLELARQREAFLVFLSTSRVYPVAGLEELALTETETRFEIAPSQSLAGVSPAGISEEFPLAGSRTLYGTTKLAAELLIEEFRAVYGLRAVVNRCGVIAGPWQMGKVDQGVFTYWMLAHYFRRPLSYIGFGGSGKQVRDLLHVADLVALLDEQLTSPGAWDGITANVGGGRVTSLSLLETTQLCAEISGHQIDVAASSESRPGDVPVYVSDCARLSTLTSWRPQRSPADVLTDIHAWIAGNENAVLAAL
jgi:CDP-paratose 2-epimerase